MNDVTENNPAIGSGYTAHVGSVAPVGARAADVTLIDGHVHYHANFDLTRFLNAACRNFQAAADTDSLCGAGVACLLLAEIESVQPLERIQRAAATLASPWSIESTAESLSLLACRNGQPVLAVIAGRQLTTTEGLEVLALATNHSFSRQRSADELIREIHDQGAMPVVPWGVGKWLFERGRVVRRLLASNSGSDRKFYLGDNAARARGLPASSLLRAADALGIPILPGTDPLDVPSHIARAGRYGFVVAEAVTSEKPAGQIAAWLQRTTAPIQHFGRRDRITDLIRSQVAIRVRKVVS